MALLSNKHYRVYWAQRACLLTRYIQQAMKRAVYKILDDGQYFGEIPGLRGVWASARSRRACQKELQEVLEEWLVLKIRDHDPIPRIGGISLSVKAA
jgi:predicted RNase H-like HicB family nuclease